MQINGVFERWSLQTPDGRSVYRNSHNWYLYFEPAGNRWLISSGYPRPSDYGSAFLRSSSDGALCPETASGWQQFVTDSSLPVCGPRCRWGCDEDSCGANFDPCGGYWDWDGGIGCGLLGLEECRRCCAEECIDVVCEGCPVASLSSWRVFNLDYQLDEVFQQGGLREIELALDHTVTNALPFPAASGEYEFTSTVSNSFSFELAAESLSISGGSTANNNANSNTNGNTNSNSNTETVNGPGRRQLAWSAAIPIVTSVIPVSANTSRP